ncbi:MAG: hypothetical protein J6Y13_10685 [Treponema sp.]|nr:hypothetical protein [Treponema sp.]
MNLKLLKADTAEKPHPEPDRNWLFVCAQGGHKKYVLRVSAAADQAA